MNAQAVLLSDEVIGKLANSVRSLTNQSGRLKVSKLQQSLR